MKVTVENYQELASRTMASLGSQAVDGAHMALGITTEIGELKEAIAKNDLVNIKEEHGDCLWYLANICNIYNHFFSAFTHTVELEEFTSPFKLHDMVDLHKRELAYGKKMDREALFSNVSNCLGYLLKVEKQFGFTLEESMQLNIDKLLQRFPDKFTKENALNRDLNKERKILEG